MIRINNLKLNFNHTKEQLKENIANKLNISQDYFFNYNINKRSIDSRKKDKMIYFIYSVDVEIDDENRFLGITDVDKIIIDHYKIPKLKNKKNIEINPIVVGSGPSGLFCALILAEAGMKPIIFEKGSNIEKRIEDVNTFWNKGILNVNSNVQFGEGGAGTFSDGKLTTLIKDKNNRIKKIFQEFVDCGAPKDIIINNKPHIGTNILRNVIINLRKKIISLGGQFFFNTQVIDLLIKNNKAYGIITSDKEKVLSDFIIIAIGHSSRDTFKLLLDKNIKIEQKSFSVGLRIEHPREYINKLQYGKYFNDNVLGAAEYKLSYKCSNNRGVYTFCMCPGGFVVASSSENNSVVTNGMSNYNRNAENSNSALLVSVTPNDFSSKDPLSGVEFQRNIEKLSFNKKYSYMSPVQTLGDFMIDKESFKFSDVKPSYKPGFYYRNLNDIFPKYIIKSLKDGIINFEKKFKGFMLKNAVLTAPETRSSSPIRITRNDNFESVNCNGLFPIGEGAGYAGGITSSAVDGIKAAEKIIENINQR